MGTALCRFDQAGWVYQKGERREKDKQVTRGFVGWAWQKLCT